MEGLFDRRTTASCLSAEPRPDWVQILSAQLSELFSYCVYCQLRSVQILAADVSRRHRDFWLLHHCQAITRLATHNIVRLSNTGYNMAFCKVSATTMPCSGAQQLQGLQ